MEDLRLGRIAALVPEFAVKDLPLGRTLMMMKRKELPKSSAFILFKIMGGSPGDVTENHVT